MRLEKIKKSPELFTFIFLVSLFFITSTPLSEEAGNKKEIKMPPFGNGGITSLWYWDHKYIKNEYGDFELLNFDNIDFPVKKDSITFTTWKLTAMGNFLGNDNLQFATLAKVKNHPGGLLLIMFEWHDASDSSEKPHGIFHQSFIGKEHLLLRTRQAHSSGIDTLEFSCGNLKSICGKAYYDEKTEKIEISIVGKN